MSTHLLDLLDRYTKLVTELTAEIKRYQEALGVTPGPLLRYECARCKCRFYTYNKLALDKWICPECIEILRTRGSGL